MEATHKWREYLGTVMLHMSAEEVQPLGRDAQDVG